MTKIRLMLRNELVRCDSCKKIKEFAYLSDFKYGQRLVFFDKPKMYAYINLIEDSVYISFVDMVCHVLKEKKIEVDSHKQKILIDRIFGIACDDIDGMKIDFLCKQKRCLFCGSEKFERNMIAPEQIIELEVPVISHNVWNKLSKNEQIKKIKKEVEEISNKLL